MKITAKQAVYLHARAKVVRRNLDKLKKKLSRWDRKYGPGTMIGPWGEMEPEGTLGDGIQKAIQITNSTYYEFTAISVSEQQKQAAKDFFEDILSCYARLMERARVAPSCHSDCYAHVRDEAIQAMELNASAYEAVADGGLIPPRVESFVSPAGLVPSCSKAPES